MVQWGVLLIFRCLFLFLDVLPCHISWSSYGHGYIQKGVILHEVWVRGVGKLQRGHSVSRIVYSIGTIILYHSLIHLCKGIRFTYHSSSVSWNFHSFAARWSAYRQYRILFLVVYIIAGINSSSGSGNSVKMEAFEKGKPVVRFDNGKKICSLWCFRAVQVMGIQDQKTASSGYERRKEMC